MTTPAGIFAVDEMKGALAATVALMSADDKNKPTSAAAEPKEAKKEPEEPAKPEKETKKEENPKPDKVKKKEEPKPAAEAAKGGYDRWSKVDEATIDYGYLSKTGGEGIATSENGGFYITTAIVSSVYIRHTYSYHPSLSSALSTLTF